MAPIVGGVDGEPGAGAVVAVAAAALESPAPPTPPAVAATAPTLAPPRPPALLIRFIHGLGDCVQLQVVLAHLRHFLPTLPVDVEIGRGKASAVRHLCRQTFESGVDAPADPINYTRIEELGWFENYNRNPEFPQTKPINCLMEVFGIRPTLELCRYSFPTSEATKPAEIAAKRYLDSITNGRKTLILHYQGNTSETKKNLPHEVAAAICTFARKCGWCVVILDWDGRTPLVDNQWVFNPGTANEIWGQSGTGDAGTIAELIRAADLFVGVDSGPLHIAAGVVETPAIAVWLEHLPVQFCDLSEHVVHVVPEDWRGRPPVNGDVKVSAFMWGRYILREYPVDEGLHTGAAAVLLREMSGKMGVSGGSGGGQTTNDSGLISWGEFWIHADNVYQDLIVVKDVFENDSYQTYHLPSGPNPSEFIVDIGAHIGSFAKRWKAKNPAARIICVEACPENFPALVANVGEFAETIQAACTYLPGDLALMNACFRNCASTGGSIVIPADELPSRAETTDATKYHLDARPLAKITLEEIMERFGATQIDVLKLDCEGAEFSILADSPAVHDGRVRFILGEYHGPDRWEELRRKRFAGWDYGHMFESGECGIFHLRSPHPAPVKQAVARFNPPTVHCVHRGDLLTTVGCDGCEGGRAPVQIFDCTKHGECTVDRFEPRIRYCGTCEDFTA